MPSYAVDWVQISIFAQFDFPFAFDHNILLQRLNTFISLSDGTLDWFRSYQLNCTESIYFSDAHQKLVSVLCGIHSLEFSSHFFLVFLFMSWLAISMSFTSTSFGEKFISAAPPLSMTRYNCLFYYHKIAFLQIS